MRWASCSCFRWRSPRPQDVNPDKSAALALFLLGCSLTGQIHSLLLASLLIGMAATMAQDIVPAAAILAPEGKQGKPWAR
jgi:hypothetical protein